jgi:hypothetical protein
VRLRRKPGGVLSALKYAGQKYAMKQDQKEKGSKAFDKMMAECIEC